jgi:DNA-binding response OmpR family regulator
MPDGSHVLIVDEDAFLAGIYARRFEMGNWDVHVAESVEEAKRHSKKHTPDAVLIDTETVEDGLDFLRDLRKDPETAGITLVALTKLGDKQQIENAYDAGADAYLLKGHFVPVEVRQKVERLVSETN